MRHADLTALPQVTAAMAYTDTEDPRPPRVRIFPPNSGRRMESPRRTRVEVPVYDCRSIAAEITLDLAGFELRKHQTSFSEFYNPARVRSDHYAEMETFLANAIGAIKVFVFDHNVRSQARADRGDDGVRQPVDSAHNDYTLNSGPRRIYEILEERGALDFAGQRCAIINIWRPIIGPVQDFPLAVCDARSTKPEDFIATPIEHFVEGNLDAPSLAGEIYSFRHSTEHVWFYVKDMHPDEVLFLKCFDTGKEDQACFTGHTGFRNPACPADYTPRESIELRTVVVFPKRFAG